MKLGALLLSKLGLWNLLTKLSQNSTFSDPGKRNGRSLRGLGGLECAL
tara:strand:- start:228 stop:371 length:144 start_codon:yes stop_codon:yes gene_type:complete